MNIHRSIRQFSDLAGTLTQSMVSGLTAALAALAPLASPALTGTPTAPTPTTLDISTTIATTAFVHAVATGGGIAVGATISGATAKEILFADASGNLATGTLGWDETALSLTFPSTTVHPMVLAMVAAGTANVFRWKFGSDNSCLIGCFPEGSNTASGPVFQMFPDTWPGLNGQMYFDSGNDTAASLNFRTGAGSGAEVNRLNIKKAGAITFFGDDPAKPVMVIRAASGQSAHFLDFEDSTGAGTAALTATGAYIPPTQADAAAANNSVFIGSDHSSKLCFKDGSGTVNLLY